jgi:hypothetical protein
MTTTIRTDSPRELLALIPYQLGFRPTDSLVVVSIRALLDIRPGSSEHEYPSRDIVPIE